MVAFNRKTEGVKQVSTHLSPRGNRTNSGQVHSSWVGVSAPQNAATSLSATPANTSVSIAFTPPTDNGGMTITNYQYAISSNGGSTYSAYAALSPADGVSPITVTGLTQNTAYLIKLKAVNDVGVSDVESSPVSFTSQGVPTSAPSSLSSTQTNTTATISFTAAASSTSITNYEYSFNNSSWTALSPADAASPVTVTGLTQNTAYTIYLRGVNSYGSGPGSTGLSLTTQGVPTSAPSSLSSIQTNNSVAISFTAAASSTALTNYEYSFNNSSWTALSPADAVSPVTISGLSQNTAYNIYLRGVNSYGSGPGSTATSFTTFGPPTGTTTISSVSLITTTTARVNFSTTAGGSAITGYDYYLSSWIDAAVSSSPKDLSGLSPGTSYTVYMRPKNSYGIGPQSAGFAFSTSAQLEFFVVAGGGGGGAGFNNGQVAVGGGSGGGGGGSQTGVVTSIAGTYTITVGARGTGGGYPSPSGGTGGTSSVVNPSSGTVVSAAGGGGGVSNVNPSTSGGGGGGTTWNGASGNNVGGTTNGWTGTNVQYSSSGQVGIGGVVTGDGVGRGGNGGTGNPGPGVAGGSGVVYVRIPSGQAAKITGQTGAATTFTASGYTFYGWTSSGTLVIS